MNQHKVTMMKMHLLRLFVATLCITGVAAVAPEMLQPQKQPTAQAHQRSLRAEAVAAEVEKEMKSEEANALVERIAHDV